MIRSIAIILCLLGSVGLEAQQPVPRAIRRDVPLTNAIRRAYDAGTRDTTGRPGPELLAAPDRLHDQRPARSGDADDHRHRDDHAAQQQSAGADGDPPAARSQHLPRARAARHVGAGGEHRRHGRHAARRQRRGGRPRARAAPAAAAGAARRRAAPRRLAASADSIRRSRASRWRRPIAAKSTATLEIAWRTKLPGGPDGRGHRMTQRFDDTLFQPTQWFPRIAKYDDLRGWDTSLYLGPAEFYNNFGRFDVSIDVPGGWIVSGTGVLQNPQEVLTATARERLAHVLESDDVITIVGEDESRPRPVDRARRSARVALRRRHGQRLRVGDGEELRLARDARDDSRQGPGPDPHGLPAERTRTSTPTPGRSRATRSSSTRSSGRRIRFRS